MEEERRRWEGAGQTAPAVRVRLAAWLRWSRKWGEGRDDDLVMGVVKMEMMVKLMVWRWMSDEIGEWWWVGWWHMIGGV